MNQMISMQQLVETVNSLEERLKQAEQTIDRLNVGLSAYAILFLRLGAVKNELEMTQFLEECNELVKLRLQPKPEEDIT